MIKLLIFDAGDLLWTGSGGTYESAMKEFFKKHNIDGKIVISRWNKIKYRVEIGKIKYRDAAKIQLNGLSSDEKLAEKWVEMHMSTELIGKRLYPEVKTTLRKLKKHYKLAILTDDYKGKEQKILICKKLGMKNVFNEIFSSQDICYKKPQRGAFFTVLKHFKVKPTEAVFIGHSKDEVEGARKFNIKTIVIRWDRGTKSDFYVKRFSEIPKILEKIK